MKLDDYGAGRNGSPSAAMAQLVRATQSLHQLEREANDFGQKGASIKAVIIVPATMENMSQWQQLANGQIPGAGEVKKVEQVSSGNVSIEDAIIGEPGEGEE